MFVYDLDNEINNFESKSYIKLCRISGRPTFRHLCMRSCQIILSQSNFVEWSQTPSNLRNKMSKFQSKLVNFSFKNETLYNYKKDKDLLNLYLNQPSKLKRNQFVLFITERYFRSDLKRKGYHVDESPCSICNEDMEDDEIGHILKKHIGDISSNKFAWKCRTDGKVDVSKLSATKIKMIFDQLQNNKLIIKRIKLSE